MLADSKIHVLGSFSNIKIARDAVCDLILGTQPVRETGREKNRVRGREGGRDRGRERIEGERVKERGGGRGQGERERIERGIGGMGGREMREPAGNSQLTDVPAFLCCRVKCIRSCAPSPPASRSASERERQRERESERERGDHLAPTDKYILADRRNRTLTTWGMTSPEPRPSPGAQIHTFHFGRAVTQ